MQLDEHNSPFLPLPAPHTNLILTPPLITDGPAAIELFNNPAIYMNLTGPPYPYTQADSDAWFPPNAKLAEEAIAQWKAAEAEREGETGGAGRSWNERKWVSDMPLSCIREGNTTTLIGGIGIRRALFETIADGEARKKVMDANDALEVGDPGIEWEVGFYLSPSYHRRGIMPVVLKTVIDGFFVPYMNGRRLTGSYFEHNSASKRVLEKCGFVFDSFVPDAVELVESKTGVKGKRVGLGTMRWSRKA